MVNALFPRPAEDSSELSLREGDRLTIVERGEEGGGGGGGEGEGGGGGGEGEGGGGGGEGGGWWVARNSRGECGMVPSSFLGFSPQLRSSALYSKDASHSKPTLIPFLHTTAVHSTHTA